MDFHCARGLASPNCIAYYELLNYVSKTPGKIACSIEVMDDNPLEELGHPMRPLEIMTVTTAVLKSTIPTVWELVLHLQLLPFKKESTSCLSSVI